LLRWLFWPCYSKDRKQALKKIDPSGPWFQKDVYALTRPRLRKV